MSDRSRRYFFRSWWPRSRICTTFDEMVEARTSDGLTLRIERIRPAGETRRRPVVLLHGFSANGLVFNYPGHSLALYLAEHGFDCYVPDIRGARHSDKPNRGWSLDDLLERDIPAIIEAVIERGGADAVHWVGHSLGGILPMMYAIENAAAPIDGLVSLGSTLDFRPGREQNVYPPLIRLLPLVSLLRLPAVPYHLLARLQAPLAGEGDLRLSEKMNFQRDNMELKVLRLMLVNGFEGAPTPMLQGLARGFTDEGLRRANGSIRYLENAHRFRPRALLVGGSRDVQCPPEAVEATAACLKNARQRRVMHFGKAHGQAEEYGHFDLILGKNASREVWPHIRDWLVA